jgi:hypothetical protein
VRLQVLGRIKLLPCKSEDFANPYFVGGRTLQGVFSFCPVNPKF